MSSRPGSSLLKTCAFFAGVLLLLHGFTWLFALKCTSSGAKVLPLSSRQSCHANWARLIRKIYETDPLSCPKCNGAMRILAFIEEAAVIRKILDHLGLWDIQKRMPKQGRGPPVITDEEPRLVYADSQVIEYEEAYFEPEYEDAA